MERAKPKSLVERIEERARERAERDVAKKLGEKRAYQKFFRLLAQTGNATKSARKAGLPQTRVWKYRNESEAFRAKWVDALRLYRQGLVMRAERELEHRGIHGWNEPVYQGGKLVGHKRKKSDACLLETLRANAPKRYARSRADTPAPQAPSVVVNIELQRAMLADPVACALAAQLDAQLIALATGAPRTLELKRPADEPLGPADEP
jgi:hypothetical protein